MDKKKRKVAKKRDYKSMYADWLAEPWCDKCGHRNISIRATSCPKCNKLLTLTNPHQRNVRIMDRWICCGLICVIAFIYFSLYYGAGLSIFLVALAWAVGSQIISHVFKNK